MGIEIRLEAIKTAKGCSKRSETIAEFADHFVNGDFMIAPKILAPEDNYKRLL